MQNLILITLLTAIRIIIIVKAQTQHSNTRNVHAINTGNIRNYNSDFNNFHRNIRSHYHNEYSTTLNYLKTSSHPNVNAEKSRNYYNDIKETTSNINTNSNSRIGVFEYSQPSEGGYYETFLNEDSTKTKQNKNEFEPFNNRNSNFLNKSTRSNQENYGSQIDRSYLGNHNIYSDENSEENYRSTTKHQKITTKNNSNKRLTTTTTRKSSTKHTSKTSRPSNNLNTTRNLEYEDSKTKSTLNNYDRQTSSLYTTELIRNYDSKNISRSFGHLSSFITTPTTLSRNKHVERSSTKSYNRVPTTKSRINSSKKRISQRKYEEYMKKIFDHSNDISHKISSDEFDGRDVAEPGQYPHMAAIGFKTTTNSVEWQCGGSLIDEYFVITAAHCTELNGQKPFYVKIGAINLNVNERTVEPQSLTIKDIYKHPKYTKSSYYNDIALIKLSSRALFTEFVYPIRLWEQNTVPYKKVFAMGYGATKFGKAKTNILTHLNLTLVSNTECDNSMPKINETKYGILNSQICAIDPIANRDTCQGDSGGPLQLNMEGSKHIEYVLIGITSYGLGCGGPLPSVYTRVSAFLDWIEDAVWLN